MDRTFRMQILVFLVVCAVLLAGAVFLIYNHLVRLRVQMRNAFSQIDVQLKRRHELVPNLVNTARGYLEHERETLESVMAARGRARLLTPARVWFGIAKRLRRAIPRLLAGRKRRAGGGACGLPAHRG